MHQWLTVCPKLAALHLVWRGWLNDKGWSLAGSIISHQLTSLTETACGVSYLVMPDWWANCQTVLWGKSVCILLPQLSLSCSNFKWLKKSEMWATIHSYYLLLFLNSFLHQGFTLMANANTLPLRASSCVIVDGDVFGRINSASGLLPCPEWKKSVHNVFFRLCQSYVVMKW